MTVNTSATGGFLAPTPVPGSIGNTEDDALTDLLQEVVAGITGIAGALVRPRWQPDPPTEPDLATTWCGVGITGSEPDSEPVITHHPDGDGFSVLERDEVLTIAASFYGPGAGSGAGRLRDGLSVSQNREALFLHNMGLVDIGSIVAAADLADDVWRPRHDIEFRVRRRVRRVYPILNVLSGQGSIKTEKVQQTWTAGPGQP